jgi:molybdopterin-synthase adenylyltransferase
MDDASLLRYSRHILLEQIGVEGQQCLLDARALVVGAGGLGSPAAIYLAVAGVGRITLVDGDAVELSNLQRQILHTTGRIGQGKAESGRIALQDLNPQVRVDARQMRAGPVELQALACDADIVLDCSDNRATRYALNRACLAARVPLVSGAASAFSGQLAVFDFRRANSACYACLFPEGPGEDEVCAVTGVFAPLTGMVGAIQAGEAIKLLCKAGADMAGVLLGIDALDLAFERIRIPRAPDCPVCGPPAA